MKRTFRTPLRGQGVNPCIATRSELETNFKSLRLCGTQRLCVKSSNALTLQSAIGNRQSSNHRGGAQ